METILYLGVIVIYSFLTSFILYLVSKFKGNEIPLVKCVVYGFIFGITAGIGKLITGKIIHSNIVIYLFSISFGSISMYSFGMLEENKNLTIQNIAISMFIIVLGTLMFGNLGGVTIG